MAIGTVESVGDDQSFGGQLRRLRKLHRYSGKTLAAAIKERLPDASVSGQTVSGWERGEWMPKKREIVEVVDELLGADGSLVTAAGYVAQQRLEERVTSLEHRVGRIEQLLEGALAHPADPATE